MESFSRDSYGRKFRERLFVAVAVAASAFLLVTLMIPMDPVEDDPALPETSVPTGLAIEEAPAEGEYSDAEEAVDPLGEELLTDEARPPEPPVHWRNPVPEHVDLVWERLHGAALSGDATAAYELGNVLMRCMRSGMLRGVPRDDRPTFLERYFPDRPDIAAGILAMHENCDTDAERLNSAPEWLMMAAQNGDERAAFAFVAAARHVYRDADQETRDWSRAVAVDLLAQHRDTGNIRAALIISQLTIRTDPEAAYAHSALVISMVESGSLDLRAADANGLIQTASRIMVRTQQSMTPAQMRSASASAVEMYSRCCT